jgi:GTP cyclohydrolase I
MPNEIDQANADALLLRGYEMILEALKLMGYDTSEDNFCDTAARAARAVTELIRPVSEIQAELDQLMIKTFPARYDEMVISKHNICFGVCPHHLLPVVYRVSVAYLPMDRVVGISKLSRVIRLMARRPVLQENFTHELADLLFTRLNSRGSAAYIEGLHMCMAARGIEAHEARVVTSAVRGIFRDQLATRQEFLDLVTAPPLQLL